MKTKKLTKELFDLLIDGLDLNIVACDMVLDGNDYAVENITIDKANNRIILWLNSDFPIG